MSQTRIAVTMEQYRLFARLLQERQEADRRLSVALEAVLLGTVSDGALDQVRFFTEGEQAFIAYTPHPNGQQATTASVPE